MFPSQVTWTLWQSYRTLQDATQMPHEKQDLLISCCDLGGQKSPSCQHSGLTGTVSSKVMSPVWDIPEPVNSGDQGTTKADSLISNSKGPAQPPSPWAQ